MNTINNPLILKWREEQYKVNKPADQSGEYIDKALADEMLNFLEELAPQISLTINKTPTGELRNRYTILNIKLLNLILKVKGE
jgi:hypothetical protein